MTQVTNVKEGLATVAVLDELWRALGHEDSIRGESQSVGTGPAGRRGLAALPVFGISPDAALTYSLLVFTVSNLAVGLVGGLFRTASAPQGR